MKKGGNAMRDIFPGFYRPDNENFKSIWENCLFIFDTNVLLGLYRLPQNAFDEYLLTLKQISDRIWIPHQVALEFQLNRLDVIFDQLDKYKKVDEIINETKTSLSTKFDQLELKKRHSSINPDVLITKIEEIFASFKDELAVSQKKQLCISDDDSIRLEVDRLFDKKIGDPLSEEEIDALYKEGKIRYENKQPPGYKDIGKCKPDERFYTYRNLKIDREFGDLIIWFEIIKMAKEKKIANIIFITDDEKEDWWWIFKGQTIGPRPELIHEIIEKSNVGSFYMYKSPSFLNYAKQYLGARINSETINQVDEISKFQNKSRLSNSFSNTFYKKLDSLVLNWLHSRYPNHYDIENSRRFPDFRIIDPKGTIGFEYKVLNDIRLAKIRWNDLIYRGFFEITQGNFDNFIVCFVTMNTSSIENFDRLFSNEIPKGVCVIVLRCFLNEDNDPVDLHLLIEKTGV